MKLVPITASFSGHLGHLLGQYFIKTNFDKACFIARIHEPRILELLRKLKKENPFLFEYEIHPAKFNFNPLVKYIVENKMQDFLNSKYISINRQGDWYQPTQEVIQANTY